MGILAELGPYWRRQCQPTPVLLPRNSHGWRSLVGCSPWGCWVGHGWTTSLHFSLSCIGEGNGNPLQCFCLEDPRDGGAWWAAIYGVAQSRTRLKKRLSSSPGSTLQRKVSTFGDVPAAWFPKLTTELSFLPQKNPHKRSIIKAEWNESKRCNILHLSRLIDPNSGPPILNNFALMLSHEVVSLFTTSRTLAHLVPQSMGFSKQEPWSGLPFSSPGDLPDPGIKPIRIFHSKMNLPWLLLWHFSVKRIQENVIICWWET